MNDGGKWNFDRGRSTRTERSDQGQERFPDSDGTDNSSNKDAKPNIVDRLPHVSLPKGGGAIRGIGEKFSVNPVTGSAALSLPLPLSPGRPGFTPSLELSYDSDSGNGMLGFGWKFSLGSVTRKTDKGLPQYGDGDESDVFILAGAEDLVPILDGGGARVRRQRTVHGSRYEISPYRPRIEGLFARIERWQNLDTGTSYWRTVSSSNVTTLYGCDPSSCVNNPANPAQIFSYLISRSWDDRGNLAVYDYLPEDNRGVNMSQAHEANRDNGVRSTQRYLHMVRYGNVQPYFADWGVTGADTALPADWMFKVVFDYGNHDQQTPLPDPDQVWPVRPDSFSTYRAGFEIRTYRRLKRLLYFNNFPQEDDVGADCLVRSNDFVYSDENNPVDSHNPIYTFLVSISQTGYRRNAGVYTSRPFPPLEFEYSQPQIQPDVLTLDSQSIGNAPEGIGGTRFHWVDLDGEGLSGILTDWDGAWGYKPNLSPTNRVAQSDGSLVARAKFGSLESVGTLPFRSQLGAQQLIDLSGSGRLDVVDFARPNPGFFKRTSDSDWEPFKQFLSWPDINWSEPNLRFVDLTGDGLADVLITEDSLYTLYPSLGHVGYDEAKQVRTPWDEDRGPKVVLSDGTETIFLADMSGDGLHDVVRVRNGEVVYWPNTGYGRFGRKITMDLAPRFVDEERFDPRRIRLADVDGSGTTDLMYIGSDGIHVCFNQSGNAWATPVTVAIFPAADRLSDVNVVDLLGTGTACVVWSSPLPGQTVAPLRYVDLMGGTKPHLLTNVQNNLGAETRISYAPSTQFYVADKLAGTPWVTRLPFPVQVVERVETFDWIGRNRLVTRYAYHHGYFDGYEREFRGFGMVEQWDTEEYRNDFAFPDGETLNWNEQSWSPPVLTRTWFHTGAFTRAANVSRQYESEYWIEPALSAVSPRPMLLLDTVLPVGMNPFEIQEAYRSLKGQRLRTEVYGQDGTAIQANPYSVEEQNFTIEFLQTTGVNRHAVFSTHAREKVSFHYERNPDDPRVTHDLTLEVNAYGDVLRGVSIGYPRRAGYIAPEPSLSTTMQGMLAYDQTRIHVVGTENGFTNAIDDPVASPDFYRKPELQRTVVAELTGIKQKANVPGVTNLFEFEEFDTIWQTAWDGMHDIPYESIPASDVDGAGELPSTATRRIVQQSLTVYRSDDLTVLLAPGVLQSLGLPGDSYRQALTPGLVANIFGALVSSANMTEAGYVQLAGETGWWIPTGRVFYSLDDADPPAQERTEALANFYLPRRFADPLNAISRVSYIYNLLPATATDAVGNATSALYDFRVLQPKQITDANGNRTQTAFDVVGMLTGTAIMGKTTENLGDSLTRFVTDLDAPTVAAHLNDPMTDPDEILGNLTTRLVYDLDAFSRNGSPTTMYTLARETHVSELGKTPTLYLHSFTYSDGIGRVIQAKRRAAAGPLNVGGPGVSVRWIGSGWTIFNNKGNAVRRYEPFFSATNTFEFAAQNGVSDVLFYDPLGRPVAVLHPDSTWEKTVSDAWRRETWDRNDTVLITDPRSDTDVGNHFSRALGSTPAAFASWYDLRKDGNFGTTTDDKAAQKEAALKTAAHAGTPAVTHFDALGRTCLTVANNGDARFASRVVQDSNGKPLAVLDALGRRVTEYILRMPQYIAGTDMAGNLLYQIGMDRGARRIFSNIAGKIVRKWDSRGHVFRNLFDPLQRLTHRYVSTGDAKEILITRAIYGEGLPALNLCGQLFRHYGPDGLTANQQFDFKGNVVSSQKVLASQYNESTDWSALANLADVSALDAASIGLLTPQDVFEASATYDALNRGIQVVTPHTATMKPNAFRPSFNEANQLSAMNVWLQRPIVPTTILDRATADLTAIVAIDYNARGQRVTVTFGNQTVTDYQYDSQTFRLTRLTTSRQSTFVQNEQTVQDLFYYYDPVGNVTRIRDMADTQDVIFFDNRRVDPTSDYTYDPLYRLARAKGREHLGQNGDALQVTNDDSPRTALRQPGDGMAMGNYTESYVYDPVGNLSVMAHQIGSGGWTRNYTYGAQSQISTTETSNRLVTTSMPGDSIGGPYSAVYDYDAHGNMTKMPHLSSLSWDEDDQLQSTTRQVVNIGTPITTCYAYDAGSQRVRKTTTTGTGTRQEERIYLGNSFELYREFGTDGTSVTLERETVHVMDGVHRVAIVETRTAGTDSGLEQVIRYQYTNHLESATLELDGEALIISYEEYFPFGSTSYQAVRSQTETPKRYRYTGKERDRENDLTYHGARYYAPWLGRWTSADPSPQAQTSNPYIYANNNSPLYVDLNGKDASSSSDAIKEMDAETVTPDPNKKLYVRAFENWQNALSQPGEEANAAYWKEQYDSLRAESYGQFSKDYAKKIAAFYAISLTSAAAGYGSAVVAEELGAGVILQSTVSGAAGGLALEGAQHALGKIGHYQKNISGQKFSALSYLLAGGIGALGGVLTGVIGRLAGARVPLDGEGVPAEAPEVTSGGVLPDGGPTPETPASDPARDLALEGIALSKGNATIHTANFENEEGVRRVLATLVGGDKAGLTGAEIAEQLELAAQARGVDATVIAFSRQNPAFHAERLMIHLDPAMEAAGFAQVGPTFSNRIGCSIACRASQFALDTVLIK